MSFDDDADDDPPLFGPPPHPDDRLWRHPSEMGAPDHRPAASSFVPSRGRPRRPWGVLAAAVGAAGAVVAGLVVAVVGVNDGAGTGDTPEEAVVEPTVATSPTVDPGAAALARDAIAPSLVSVRRAAPDAGTTAPDAGTTAPPEAAPPDAAPTTAPPTTDGVGSGVIVRADGVVVTSAQLVGDGTGPFQVHLADGRSEPADLVGTDPVTGLAVLDLAGDGFPAALPADVAGLSPGSTAFTVGRDGAGAPAATGGRVGANSRLTSQGSTPLEGVVAMDGTSAPAALGGPVVDGGGGLLAVTTAVEGDTASYSTPVDVVGKVTDDLLAGGQANHSWLGIDGLDRSGDPADNPGLQGNGDPGVVVSSVAGDGPGAAAGLQTSDVIVAVDGHEVDRMPDLVRWLRARSPGEVVQLAIRRGGTDLTLPVALGALTG